MHTKFDRDHDGLHFVAGQTRVGTVAQVTSAGGFAWFYVTWDGGNPTQGYVRTDVAQLDVPVCSWSQSPPSSVTVGTSFNVALSCVGNPTQWGWDFNGTTTSASNSKTFSFSSAGTYNTRGWGINAAGSGATATALVTVTAAAPTTPPSCAPSASATTIPVGNAITLFANCVSTTGGGGGTVFVDWSGPVPSGGPTFANPTTIQNPNLNSATTAGSFTYSVSAHDFYGYSATQQVVIQVTPPANNGVSLFQPSSNATGVSTTPSFSWSALAGASSYTLSIAPADGVGLSPTFGSNSNSFVWPVGTGGLSTNKQYKWRVQASAATLWSDYGYFTTNNTPAPAAVAIGPNVDFGQVPLGGCATIQVAVVQHLLGTAVASGTYNTSAPFDTPGSNSFTVSNGSYSPLVLRFCPTSAGTTSRAVTVSGVTSNTPMTVTGTGVGAASAPTDSAKLIIDKILDQHSETPFPIRIVASDAALTTYVYLSTASGALVKPNKVKLVNGTWIGQIAIPRPVERTILQATAGNGAAGQSNSFKTRDRANFSQVTLTSEAPPGNAKGRIILPFTSSLPAGTVLYAYGDDSQAPISASVNGSSYEISLPPGRYTLKLKTTDGSVQSQRDVDIKSAQISNIDLNYSACKPVVLLLPGMMGSTLTSRSQWLVPALAADAYPANSDQLKIYNAPSDHVGFDALHQALEVAGFKVIDVPYDWRVPLEWAAGRYLKKAIEQAKADSTCAVTKVNVIAHSMGGLVARIYIQGTAYDVSKSTISAREPIAYGGDIDQFVMVGTPNGGSALPYWMVEGGAPMTADDIAGPATFRSEVVLLNELYSRATIQAMADLGIGVASWINSSRFALAGEFPLVMPFASTIKNFYASYLPSMRYLVAGYSLTKDGAPNFTLFDTGPQYAFNIANFGLSSINSPASIQGLFTTLGNLGAASKVRTALYASYDKTKTVNKIEVAAPAGQYDHGQPIGETSPQTYHDGTSLEFGAGDGTAPMNRAVAPFLTVTGTDLTGAGACAKNGCRLPASTSIPEAVIDVCVGNFGEHATLPKTLVAPIVAALKNGAMPSASGCSLGASVQSFGRSPAGSKSTAFATPVLSISINGDALPLLLDTGGRQVGIDSTGMNVVETVPGSAAYVHGTHKSLTITAPVDGTYALSFRDQNFHNLAISTTYSDSSGNTWQRETILNYDPMLGSSTLTIVFSRWCGNARADFGRAANFKLDI